ncbi:MAG: hypothetical protein G3H99_03005 [Ferrovum sp.]|nr:hypothetical protein [Ferrovum sp.]NDU86898.1 hypothetical protein [Ferrovum sp.]
MIPFASWSVLTVDFLIVLHLCLAGVALPCLLHLVNAKWRYEVRHIAVAFFALYPLAVVLLLILLFGGELTFPWVGSFEHLPKWNNLKFLRVREIAGIIVVGVAYGAFVRMQKTSEQSPENMARFKILASIIPFIHVLYCTMVAWDFEMTLLPNWESSMFSVNYIVSVSGMFLASFVILLYTLQSTGLIKQPIRLQVFNYLAQMMLGFTILWIYTFFGQYLIIWYGNITEETGRIYQMQYGDYSPLFWAFFVMKFIIPFVTLVFPFSRHNPKVIFTIACIIVTGTWIERYTWISGTYPTPHFPMTGTFDIGVTVSVAVMAFLIVRAKLRSTKVIKP